MADRLAAERACKDANPIIDGRKANVNLAYLGAKPRGNLQSGIIWYLHLQSIYWFDLFLPLFLGGRFSCCCCCFLFFFLTFFGVWNFFFLFFFFFELMEQTLKEIILVTPFFYTFAWLFIRLFIRPCTNRSDTPCTTTSPLSYQYHFAFTFSSRPSFLDI